MTNPSPTTLRCVSVVGGAYLVQGLIFGVGAVMLQVLVALELPLETQVGLLASGAVPWVLKFGLALLLDLGPSWSFRTRAILLALVQGFAALCMWGLAEVWTGGSGGQPTSLLAVGIGWVTLNLCAATQDVIVDALALDTLAEHRSMAAAAMAVGATLGAGWLVPLVVTPRLAKGMAAVLRLPVGWIAALALITAALLWMPGRPIKAREQAEAREREPGDLGRLLAILLLLVALTFANNTLTGVGFQFVIGHVGWDPVEYNALTAPIAAVAGLLGAFAWGPVVAKLGPARATMLASALFGSAWIAFAAASPLWSESWVFAVMAASEGVLQQALFVGLHAIALLAAARSPMPTTAFVLAMAAINLPRVLGPLLAPHALLALGWVGLWIVCGAFQILVGTGLWPLRDWSRSSTRPGATAT